MWGREARRRPSRRATPSPALFPPSNTFNRLRTSFTTPYMPADAGAGADAFLFPHDRAAALRAPPPPHKRERGREPASLSVIACPEMFVEVVRGGEEGRGGAGGMGFLG